MITSFSGEHEFLSNFHRGHPFYLPGWQQLMPTAEHAYQACKAVTGEQAHWVLEAASPQLAKSRGRQVQAHPDWDRCKKRIMLKILLAKFGMPDSSLAALLVSTGTEILVEGNTWGDTFWGAVPGAIGEGRGLPVWAAGPRDSSYVLYGHSWLGRELMMVREVLA